MVSKLEDIRRILLAIFGLLALVVLVAACEEKDVPIVSDQEEILRYVNESLEGRELFRTNEFINEDTFTIPNDPAIFYDSIESVNRSAVFAAVPSDELKRYREPNITVRDAEIVVTDRITVRRYRILGVDTTSTTEIREFVRRGHFLKLGDDFRPYAGWKLFGFNGGIPQFPMSLTVTGPGDVEIFVNSGLYSQFEYARIDPQTGEFTDFIFRTSESYLRLDQISNIHGGGDIEISGNSVSTQSSYLLLGAQALAGPMTYRAARPVGDEYSIDFQSQFSPPYLWNLLVFQEYRDSAPSYIGWCVPYRVP